MAYVYGNKVTKSGGNPWRTFLSPSVSSSNDTTTFSGSMGMNPTDGWIKSGKRVYSLAGTGQTTASKTQSNVKIGSGTHTVQVSATWSWARTTTAQTKTITAKTVYTGSNQDGTSTATYSVTVPALAYYTLTYNANGGSVSPASKSVQYKSTFGTLPTPTRTGYTFSRWTNSSGTQVYSSTVMPAANTTIYAQWNIITYTVTFNANGGTNGSVTSVSKTYGSSVALTGNPTRSGWTLKGWATSANSSTVAYAPNATYSANASTVLYAVWEKNVTLSFDANQGTGAPESQVATIVNPTATTATITITNTIPTRQYYKFTGWMLGSDTYLPNTNIVISDNTTLTAQWELDYIPPQIVNTIKAVRCDSTGDEDDMGTYASVSFSWEDGSMGGTVITDETVTVEYQEQGTSTWTTATGGTKTGNSYSVVLGGGSLSLDKQYNIRVSLQNTGYDANVYTSFISTVSFTIDINADGTAVSFFEPASDSDKGLLAPPMDTTELNDFIASLNRDFRGTVDWIVEEGTNYIRTDSGIQICWLNTTGSVAVNGAYGSLYIGAYNWTFPKAFASTPTVTVGMARWGTGASWGTVSGIPDLDVVTIRIIDVASRASGTTYFQAMAIGRWK